MSVMSHFPMGRGGSYAEGDESITFNGRNYSFRISLPFVPKVIFGEVSAHSDTYADNHKTAVENQEGAAVKLLASPNGYSANPDYTIVGKGFTAAGLAPPGMGTSGAASIRWKAWG